MNWPGVSADVTPASVLHLGIFFAAEGRGILVGLIVGACLLLSDWLTGMYFHSREYYAQHGWPRPAAFFMAAMIVWLLAGHAGEIVPGSDLNAGRKPFFTRHDTLFFVPVQYWPAILCGLGMVFYFVRGH